MKSAILTGSEKTVFLISDDEGTTLAELAAAIQLTPSEARELALRLQARGLVEVGEDQHVRLTADGRKVRRSLERDQKDDIRTTAIGTIIRDILIFSLCGGSATFFRYYLDLSLWLSIPLGIILPLIVVALARRLVSSLLSALHGKFHPILTRSKAESAASPVAETNAKGLERALDEAFKRLREPATTGKGK